MQHILDVQFPDENPAGAPGGDYQQISSNPNMFGGFTAGAEKAFGEGLEKAGNTGIQIATEQAQQDARTHADEVHSWQSDKVTDRQEQFLQLKGRAALDALPAFKQDIDDIRQQAQGQAGSPYAKRLIEGEGRRLTDAAYSQAARHAASERSSWDTNTAIDSATSSASRAAIAASTTPGYASLGSNPNVALGLDRSDQFARNAAQLKGLDGDIEAQRNRGRNVGEIIKSVMADGSYSSFDRAREFFHAQYDRIDPASRATIEQSLKGIAANLDGTRTADIYMGRGPNLPPGYVNRTFQIESGGNPNAQTGSYKGLGQFSPALEARYGINDSNRSDPATQARALSSENSENHDALARALGHEPTPSDYYLAHQQGIGGAIAHLSQPNLPAWQNMYGTVEGREKGQGWAKQAIWGNMTPSMRAQFPGGVDTVTSGDFARMWAQRFYDQPIQAPGTQGVAPVAFGGIDRLRMAQDYSESHKGDVVGRINSDPYLVDHPQAMQAAITHTNRVFEANTASYADAERMLHVQQQQQKIVSDQAEDDYMKKIYAPPVGAQPLSVGQIVNDPHLNREAKDRLIGKIGKSEEKDEKTYGEAFVPALQMVHAPAGTQGRITDIDQLYDRVGKDLTFAGFQKLRDELNLKKSPEGSAESEMKKAALQLWKGQITGTDEGLHIKDPKGDELFLKFQAQVWPAYEAGRKQGKSPTQLLDPDSADYVGKATKNFKRPMDQWFADTIHDAPAGKAKFDIATVKSLDQLVTAFRAGNVTKQQADELALSNGWASRKPKIAPPVSQ